jgi:hypothetical protein
MVFTAGLNGLGEEENLVILPGIETPIFSVSVIILVKRVISVVINSELTRVFRYYFQYLLYSTVK